ncbi:MAG: methionine adenosyltransferase [Candidatus Saccharibacteria bacterium]|nr:methionine adenosyltransferase [Candidatus Saccharibacteria bacterium]
MSKSTNQTFFTSESVCAGHPDKIADRISDAILDAILAQDPHARTGIETIAGANRVELYGEINTTAKVDFEKITRDTIKILGYTNPDWGFSQESQFENHIHQQSPEIAQGTNDDDGAGDQGMMFGFAVNETPELMPLPIAIAHSLTRRLDEVREKNILSYIRPDGKSQVTVRYEDGKPVGIETVVIATAHDEDTTETEVKQGIYDHVISPVLESYDLNISKEALIVNGTGLWHIPGPESDAGLTGRKIVVDTYGGYARVGGGAFSGKDPSKVDRSGAYAARYIAKNIVAKGLATKCEVGLAYVIGKSEPLMKTIDVYGTGTVTQEDIEKFAEELIHCSVKGIVSTLDLRRPIYQATSAYGHFGDKDLPWEAIVA